MEEVIAGEKKEKISRTVENHALLDPVIFFFEKNSAFIFLLLKLEHSTFFHIFFFRLLPFPPAPRGNSLLLGSRAPH